MSRHASLARVRSAVVALAWLGACGGESLRTVGDQPGPGSTPTETGGAGGGTSTVPAAGSTAQSVPSGGGTTSAGKPASSGGSGIVAGQGAISTGGSAGATGGVSMGDAGGTTSSAGMPSGGSSGGTAEPPPSVEPPPPATWDTLKLVLTGTSPPCTGAACHSGGASKVHLGFPVKNDAQLYTVLTTYVSTDCGSFPLVTPGRPEQSALSLALKGPCSEDVPRMPNGCDDEQGNCVPDEYIVALEQWIADGAAHP